MKQGDGSTVAGLILLASKSLLLIEGMLAPCSFNIAAPPCTTNPNELRGSAVRSFHIST